MIPVTGCGHSHTAVAIWMLDCDCPIAPRPRYNPVSALDSQACPWRFDSHVVDSWLHFLLFERQKNVLFLPCRRRQPSLFRLVPFAGCDQRPVTSFLRFLNVATCIRMGTGACRILGTTWLRKNAPEAGADKKGQVTATAGRFSDSNPGPPWVVIMRCKRFLKGPSDDKKAHAAVRNRNDVTWFEKLAREPRIGPSRRSFAWPSRRSIAG